MCKWKPSVSYPFDSEAALDWPIDLNCGWRFPNSLLKRALWPDPSTLLVYSSQLLIFTWAANFNSWLHSYGYSIWPELIMILLISLHLGFSQRQTSRTIPQRMILVCASCMLDETRSLLVGSFLSKPVISIIDFDFNEMPAVSSFIVIMIWTNIHKKKN